MTDEPRMSDEEFWNIYNGLSVFERVRFSLNQFERRAAAEKRLQKLEKENAELKAKVEGFRDMIHHIRDCVTPESRMIIDNICGEALKKMTQITDEQAIAIAEWCGQEVVGGLISYADPILPERSLTVSAKYWVNSDSGEVAMMNRLEMDYEIVWKRASGDLYLISNKRTLNVNVRLGSRREALIYAILGVVKE